jgi:membrane protein
MFGFLKKSFNRFLDDDCTTMSAAIAYYTTFSIAPLLLIVIAVVGLIFGRDVVQQQIQNQVQGLIGKGPATLVGAMVQSAGQHASSGIISAVLGMIALLAGATGAFTQLHSSLNRVWRGKQDPNAGGVKAFIGVRILSLGMIFAIAFLLVVSLAVSAAISAFGTWMAAYLPQGFSGALLQVLGFVASFLILATLFASMFKVLPDARIEWRDVWIGAVTTSLLFTIGKTLIGIYLGHSGAASAYGAAGSFVLIVLWINYSALIFLLGAELTSTWSEAHHRQAEPKPGAVRVHVEENVEPPRRAA